jgi:hypothetical protein
MVFDNAQRGFERTSCGALPIKIKEMLFSILDSVTGEGNGAKAHAKAAIDAGLTM